MGLMAGGGGGTGYPGVSSDGNSRAGLIISGGIDAGRFAVNDVAPPSYILRGATQIKDSHACITDSDSPLTVIQSAAVGAVGRGLEAFYLARGGSVVAADYQSPAVTIDDLSASAQPAFTVNKSSAAQFQVDGDGVRIHAKIKTGASVAHALGAYSGNSVPIYDEAGTLLGYMPLYA